MLTREQNDTICRTGPGTLTGDAIRRYWVPFCMSSELAQPEGDPLHVELLGENFVAFRDHRGQVGLLDEHCTHRGASLTVGRSENGGIRCIYHGWLFSADGTVLETPNVPDEGFRSRIRAKAYPVRESGGLLWTYLGPPAKEPPFPAFPWAGTPDEKRLNVMTMVGCNYVQVIEGLLDSTHLTFLHSSALARPGKPDIAITQSTKNMGRDGVPRIHSEMTDFGLQYAAVRTIDGQAEAHVTAFVAPFWIYNPSGDIYSAVVPLTDTRTAFYRVIHDGAKDYGLEPLRSHYREFIGAHEHTLEEFGLARKSFDSGRHPSRENGWRQDRAAMAAGHFTGMSHLGLEDVLVCVSSGGVRDRSAEHLASPDAAIAHLYRTLLKSAADVKAGGNPVGLDAPVGTIRATHGTLAAGADWRSLVPQNCPGRTPELTTA